MGAIIRQEKPPQPLSYTGERLTTAVSGQVEIEHLHRYLMARELCAGKDVLDVACGEGYGAALLSQVARSVTGVDIDFGVVAHATRAYRRDSLRFTVSNAQRLPLAAACVDIVTSFETLEHFAEQEAFVAEARRVLRPGGLFVISTPDREIYSGVEQQDNPFHARELSRSEFASLLARTFSHVALYGQRPVIGSALVPESGTAASGRPVIFDKLDRDRLERCESLPRALYLIAIASDREIESRFPGSLYIDTGEVQGDLGFNRTAARAQVLELRAALYGRSAEADRLRRELAQVREQQAAETGRLRAEAAAAQARLDAETGRLKEELAQAREEILERGVRRRLRRHLRQAGGKIPGLVRGAGSGVGRAIRFVIGGRASRQPSPDAQLIVASGLFDRDWYLARYADVRASGHDPAEHYLQHGVADGRDPGPSFDTKWYLEQNPDVRAGGDNPLVHYLRFGVNEGRAQNQAAQDAQAIAASGLFDRDWYLAQYADVREGGDDALLHYLKHGGLESRDPGPSFSSDRYLDENPDVRAAGVNPLVHYLRNGAVPERKQDQRAQDLELIRASGLLDPDWYLGKYADIRFAGDDPAVHYLVHGGAEGRDPGPLFDSDWYLEQNPDVRAAGDNPLVHYLRHGVADGRDPNPVFDTDWYLTQNPDVRSAGLEPLAHYLRTGAAHGRDPGPRFDTRWYLSANPEVAAAGLNPLAHYLEWGLPEGKPAHEPRQFLRLAAVRERREVAALSRRPPLRRWQCGPRKVHADQGPGVNLIGPVEYVSGLGVSARGFAASLMHAGIPLNVVPWRLGFQQLRPIPVDYPSRELQPINLIHLNLDLMQDEGLLDVAPLADIATADRYNIAIISWELAAMPSEWVDLIHRFDEVWASSSFMVGSVAAVSARPTRVVRPAVNLPSPPGRWKRADLGLPEERFIFGYVADASSQLGRKNPRVLIEAFVEEFTPGDGACCLIKIGHSSTYNAEMQAMRAIAAQRPDVILMDRQLEETQLSELYDLIDCYVSPHRSEGLGLTILEAMNARKPVIVTPYGGVKDFLTPDTAMLIDYQLVEVGTGRPPYPPHAVWADPVKSSLRDAMRKLFGDRDLARNLGLRGHAFASDMFSLDGTAREIRAEIDRIWTAGGGSVAAEAPLAGRARAVG